MIYCVVPRAVAVKAFGALERHFGRDSQVELVVDSRQGERRVVSDRREFDQGPLLGGLRFRDRRRVNHVAGRRVADRRAVIFPHLATPELPRSVRRVADQLSFVARVEPSSRAVEDAGLLRAAIRVQAGEAEAFEHVYKTLFDRVYGHLRLARGSAVDVEELLQAVFGCLFERLPNADLDAQPIRAWLGDILFATSFTPQPETEESRARSSFGGDADLQVLEWLSDHDLLSLVERLPPLQRQVLGLHYLLGLKISEVAQVAGRSADEVADVHGAALGFMAGCLTSLGRRPGYSGRHPMSARRRVPVVSRARSLALIG